VAAAHLVSLPSFLQWFFSFFGVWSHFKTHNRGYRFGLPLVFVQVFKSLLLLLFFFLPAAFNNLCKERAREGEVFCCLKNKRRKKTEKKSQRCGFWSSLSVVCICFILAPYDNK